jgi:hypothetical protein
MSDLVFDFSPEAARVMCGGAPTLDPSRRLAGYYVSAPSGTRATIVDDLSAARRRERGYDRRARRCHGPGAGYDAHIVPVYYDGTASGPWAAEAEAHLRSLSRSALRRRAIFFRHGGLSVGVAGHGQHSHAVPTVVGLVVEIGDGTHEGTSIWLTSRGDYCFALHDWARVTRAPRAVLIRGQSPEDITHETYGCDLGSPDGLAIVGVTANDGLAWLSKGASVLWDSAAEDPSP